MAQVLRCALNPRIAPRRILCRHPNHERSKVSLQASTARTSASVGPLARDQFTVPAQNRIWRDDRRHLREQPAPQSVSQLAQPPPLVVGEAQPPTSKPRLEDSIPFAKKCDRIRLVTMKPPTHRRDQQFEREHRRSLRCYADRSVGHYGARVRGGGVPGICAVRLAGRWLCALPLRALVSR